MTKKFYLEKVIIILLDLGEEARFWPLMQKMRRQGIRVEVLEERTLPDSLQQDTLQPEELHTLYITDSGTRALYFQERGMPVLGWWHENVQKSVKTRHNAENPDGKKSSQEEPEAENADGKKSAQEEPEAENPDGKKSAQEESEAENPDGKKSSQEEPEAENADGKKPAREEPEAENADGKKSAQEEPEAENPDGKKSAQEESEAENPDGKKPWQEESEAENADGKKSSQEEPEAENADREVLRQVRYVVESVEELEPEYPERVYRRFCNIPWDILETERCLVRETMEEDVDSFFTIYQNPEIVRYTEALYPEIEQEKQYVREYIEKVYGYFEFGVWTVLWKETGEIIGRAGFSVREGYELPELGFVIGLPWQGKGVAYEICQAILCYGWEEYGFDRVQALVRPNNAASAALCRKLGFTEQNIVYVGDKEHVLFLYEK